MSDDSRRRRSGPGRRPRPSFDDDEQDYGPEQEYDDGGGARPRRRAPGPPRRRPGGRVTPARKQGGLWSLLFASPRAQSRRPVRREGFDWAVAEEEDYRRSRRDERDDWREDEDEEDDYAPRRRPPRERSRRGERLTLMDLCTPIFGYAAILPRESGGTHPAYAQFRQEVLNALQRIETEAPEHGIDREDAAAARYALALFMDEQVAESEWSGKSQWANEPLSMVLLADPEGGKNFFRRLESMGDRQRGVKEVYLVCLAMGYRGEHAEEPDPTKQATRLGEIRQKILRSIHREPLDTMDVLFPEAYEPAVPIEIDTPPPPKLWVGLSLGGVALAILIYIVLFVSAGRAPEEARKRLEGLRSSSVSSMDRGRTEEAR